MVWIRPAGAAQRSANVPVPALFVLDPRQRCTRSPTCTTRPTARCRTLQQGRRVLDRQLVPFPALRQRQIRARAGGVVPDRGACANRRARHSLHHTLRNDRLRIRDA